MLIKFLRGVRFPLFRAFQGRCASDEGGDIAAAPSLAHFSEVEAFMLLLSGQAVVL